MSQPVHVSTEADIRDPDLLAELEGTRGTPEFADMVRYLAAKQRHRDAGQGTPAPAATIDDPDIRDADLRERLAKVPGDQFGRMMRERLLREQKARDEKSSRLASLTPLARRREAVREELAEPFNSKDRYHVHSVLALCGLPYKKPPEGQGDYVREYGRSSLVVQAGYLKDPNTGKMTKQGLPYGPKARLLLLHICTMALRQNTHEIEVADSMSAFIRELGFEVTGGVRGTIAQFKEQLHRLAATRMQIGLWRGDKTTTISTQPIEAFDVWLPSDTAQRMLWNNKLYMDEKFFRTLKDHALPVDIRAMRAFANSAKQIDIVLWLVSRLNGLERVTPISWVSLKDQFGRDITSRDRKFRQSFAEDIKAIQEIYPNLRLNLSEKGITLYPTDAKVLLVPQRKVTHKAS
jgi:hypothetical protein